MSELREEVHFVFDFLLLVRGHPVPSREMIDKATEKAEMQAAAMCEPRLVGFSPGIDLPEDLEKIYENKCKRPPEINDSFGGRGREIRKIVEKREVTQNNTSGFLSKSISAGLTPAAVPRGMKA